MPNNREIEQALYNSEGKAEKVLDLDRIAINEVLREVRDRVVQSFNPMRIILYDSYASGTPDQDSDLDLLVVMESTESPIKRAARVSCSAVHREILKDFSGA